MTQIKEDDTKQSENDSYVDLYDIFGITPK